MDSDTQVNALRVRNQNRNIYCVQLKSMHDLKLSVFVVH
jgi:hypothetical protein